MGSHDLWARNRKTVCDAAQFPCSCVNYIRSRKWHLWTFTFQTFLGGGGGGEGEGMPQTSDLRPPSPRLVPPPTNLISPAT